MMLQATHDGFHRDPAREKDAGCREQDQASHESQDQGAIIGLVPLHLTRLGGQQVLERPNVLLKPTPPAPGPDQAWCRARGRPAAQGETIAARVVDDDDRHDSIGGTGRHEADIAHPRRLRAVIVDPFVKTKIRSE